MPLPQVHAAAGLLSLFMWNRLGGGAFILEVDDLLALMIWNSIRVIFSRISLNSDVELIIIR